MNFLTRYWKASIGAAFALFLACAIAVVIINNRTQTDIFWENQQERLVFTTESCNAQVQNWVQQKEQLLNTFAGEVERNMFITPESYNDQLRYYVGLDDDIQASFIGFEDKSFYVSEPFYDPNFDVTTRDWYRAGYEANGDIAITEPYIDLLTTELIVTFVKQVPANGKTCVVGMDVSIANFDSVLESLSTSENGGAYLISKEGKVLSYDDPSFQPKIIDGKLAFSYSSEVSSRVNVLETIDTHLDSGILVQRIIDYDGVEKFVATTKIAETDWALGVNIPLSDYDAAVNNVIAAQFPLLALAILMALISIFVAVVVVLSEKRLREEQEQLMVELNETNKQLSIMTNHDALTGIFNRRYLMAFLEKRLSSYCSQRPICLLMFDLDYFKHVNDTYGHNVGDDVLVGTTTAVDSLMRAGDVFARFGGEEFIIVLESIELDQAAIVADRIRDRVAETKMAEDITITISIGVVEAREDEPLNILLDRVDVCLYRAKNEGRNKVCVHP